jgi:hypothetical protein
MLHSLQRSAFLRPRERLYEMLALQQLAVGVHDGAPTGSERLADRRTMAGHLQELLQRGLIISTNNADRVQYALTDAGKRRLRMLTIDLARELESLQDATRAMIRADLVPLALDGVQRVVFYPFGETAEMAYTVVTGLGLEVVGIVDDSPRKWGVRFHGLQVLPAATLPSLAPDAVLVTSAVFQEAILTKLKALPLEGVRIHML